MKPVASEIKGKTPIFLLRVEWIGREYLLSTKPIVLSSNRGDLLFTGGLVEDPDILFDLGDLGFNVNSNSTAIAAIFNGVNVVKEILRGNTLQNNKAAVYYVFEDDKTVQSFDNATLILSGLIKQPVTGHVDQPIGYVEFSIEAPSFNGDLYSFVSNSTGAIRPLTYSTLSNPSSSPFSAEFYFGTFLIEVPQSHLGKKAPIVFGAGGNAINDNGGAFRYPFSPCYCLAVETTSQNQIYLVIASHFVEANQTRIFDKHGEFVDSPIEHWVRRDGAIFAYVTFNLKSGGFNRLNNIVEDSGAEYYSCFAADRGGLLSSTKATYISGGGELCLEFLKLGSAEIDFAEWVSVEPILNKYKFAGYINQDEITPIEFLENEIIPFLPISVIHGADGLKPVLNFLHEGAALLVKYEINSDSDFLQNGPVQTITDSADIINEYTLGYQFDALKSKYISTMRIGNFNDNYQDQFTNLYAKLSQQKYGRNQLEEESNCIHDMNTAALVCKDRIRLNGGVLRSVEYITNVKYGYIEIGDIILLNDTNLFDKPQKVQVIRKQFKSTNWLFTVKIEDNLINTFIS